jgi:hypothetical protein
VPGAPENQPPTLASAVRRGARAFADEPVTFLAVNLVLAGLAACFSVVVVVVPVAIVAAPLLALPVAACLRLALAALDDEVPTWRVAVAELGRRAGPKLLVASVQLIVTVLGAGNLVVATSMGGIFGVASALVAIYGVVAVSVVAIALWPILADPKRDLPLGTMIRLAFAVVLSRPLQIAGLFALIVIGMVASIQLIAPAVVVPAFLLLVTAALVSPAVERLRSRQS